MTAQHRSGLVVQVAGNLGRLMSDGSVSRAVETARHTARSDRSKTLHGSIDRGFVTDRGWAHRPKSQPTAPRRAAGDGHDRQPPRPSAIAKRLRRVMKDADPAPLPTLPTVARPYVLSTWRTERCPTRAANRSAPLRPATSCTRSTRGSCRCAETEWRGARPRRRSPRSPHRQPPVRAGGRDRRQQLRQREQPPPPAGVGAGRAQQRDRHPHRQGHTRDRGVPRRGAGLASRGPDADGGDHRAARARQPDAGDRRVHVPHARAERDRARDGACT